MTQPPALDGPARLEGLIDYQDGAVVSRTLLEHPSGSLTVFAFDAAQELGEHTVPHDAFVQVLDGVVEIRIDGVPRRVESGEVIPMPANRPHAVRAVERFKILRAMLGAGASSE